MEINRYDVGLDFLKLQLSFLLNSLCFTTFFNLFLITYLLCSLFFKPVNVLIRKGEAKGIYLTRIVSVESKPSTITILADSSNHQKKGNVIGFIHLCLNYRMIESYSVMRDDVETCMPIDKFLTL